MNDMPLQDCPHPAQLRVAPANLGKRAALATSALVLTMACSPSTTGDLSSAKQIQSTCQKNVKVAGYAAIDASGSSKGNGLTPDRLAAISDLASHVALCGGTLKVTAFTSSAAATATVFEGPIPVRGATDTARARRTPKAVANVIAEITTAYGPAMKGLDGRGSDIVAQFRLAAEHARQLSDGYRLRLLVLSDGFHNADFKVAQVAKSPSGTEQIVTQFEVPDLSEADVTVAGIGQVSGGAPSTTVIDRVKGFYQALCERANAERCTVVTDFTAGR